MIRSNAQVITKKIAQMRLLFYFVFFFLFKLMLRLFLKALKNCIIDIIIFRRKNIRDQGAALLKA